MTGEALRIVPAVDRAGRERFIRLPWSLYRGDTNWVPPLLFERRQHLDPKTNPFFDHADVRLWLAVRGERCVGRVSAQIDRAYLDHYDDATGHFGMLEAEDDGATICALLKTAEDWLRANGMRRVRGPFNFSINDESGMLIDGFDTPPSLMMGHGLPYYARHLEGLGYTKAKDLIAYDYDLRVPLPAVVAAMVERVHRNDSIRLRGVTKSHYFEDVRLVLDIFNDAWSGNWGFVPFGAADMDHVAKSMRPLIDNDSVCIVEIDGEAVAMAVGLFNLNEAIGDLDGSLFPFGWAKLLWRLKFGKFRSGRVALMGVRKRYHSSALGGALAFAAVDRIHRKNARRGIERAELSWILEDNLPMRRMIEMLGAKPYKTYRIFERNLA